MIRAPRAPGGAPQGGPGPTTRAPAPQAGPDLGHHTLPTARVTPDCRLEGSNYTIGLELTAVRPRTEECRVRMVGCNVCSVGFNRHLKCDLPY